MIDQCPALHFFARLIGSNRRFLCLGIAMVLAKRWAGKVWGTNVGNVFVTLDGEDHALTGTLRMNEQGIGIAIYSITGSFINTEFKMKGLPQAEIEGIVFGELTVLGKMNSKGEIHGDWSAVIGSAGTFVLFPHMGGEQTENIQQVEQFHTARHNFGAIEIDREQITNIAESINSNFPSVVITVVAGTEQSRYLDDFKNLQFSSVKAEIVKIFASKPDGTGANQVVSIEFGPQVNSAMTQGANEAWVLGQLETLKRDLKQYEQTHITSLKKWGLNINQILLLGAIVVLPSLSGLVDRIVLMGSVLFLNIGVNWLHSRYIPFSAIYLGKKRRGLLGRVWPSFASWVIGIMATVIAALVGAYLQGWLKVPKP